MIVVMVTMMVMMVMIRVMMAVILITVKSPQKLAKAVKNQINSVKKQH